MTNSEKKDFKNFMTDRNFYLMFCNNYRRNKMAINPQTIDGYLDSVKAENVIPQAFVYPKTKFGKDFWLGVHEDWLAVLEDRRVNRSGLDMMDRLELEEIELVGRNICSGLPTNTCSLNLRNGNRLSLNIEHSKLVAKKLSTKMLLTRSRMTTDVVLMFNRVKGIDLKFRPSKGGSSSLQINNMDMADHLIRLLDLEAEKEYFQLHIEVLTETKDMILFKVSK